MHMSRENFRNVIDGWCRATGMQPWPADVDMNVDIDGVTTGLIYDEERAPHVLHVLSDLGHYEAAGLHRKLLELNAEIEFEHGVYFALDASRGSVVLRMTVALAEDVDGAELPQKISEAMRCRTQLT